MTKEKALATIERYRWLFYNHDIRPVNLPHDMFLPAPSASVNHCSAMLDQMEEFVREDRMEKFFQWLGFVQGCLWTNGYATLVELKDDNRDKIVVRESHNRLEYLGCHAGSDGECHWRNCPQLRDGEPERTRRHCPLDHGEEEEI